MKIITSVGLNLPFCAAFISDRGTIAITRCKAKYGGICGDEFDDVHRENEK